MTQVFEYAIVSIMINKKHGHHKFYEFLKEEAELHSIKNHDYAEQDKPLGNFDRVAHWIDYYNLLNAPYSTRTKVAIFYMLKQLDCLLNAYGKGKQMQAEGFAPRTQDISVYIKLFRILLEDDENKNLSEVEPKSTIC